jgi:hypothetical protein
MIDLLKIHILYRYINWHNDWYIYGLTTIATSFSMQPGMLF